MAESELSGRIVSDDACALADEMVEAHLTRFDGQWIVDHEALRADIAAALQNLMNAAELADAERRQAVAAANDLCERIRGAVDSTHVRTWITCPRCFARAPSVMELRHEVACRLSSAPPPRKSDVAPKSGREE